MFLKLKLPHVIIQLYHSHRLNKQSGTGGRLIVDHARNLSFVFSFDRNTVPAVSHGDHRILKIGTGVSVYQSGKLRMDPVIGYFHISSYLEQRRTCIITDLIFRENASSDL